MSFGQCLVFIYYHQLHCPNLFPCVFESFAAHLLGWETPQQVRDWMKLDLSSHHQHTGWLWPAHFSLQYFCFPLGTVWALCDGLLILSAASASHATAPHSCRANSALRPQLLTTGVALPALPSQRLTTQSSEVHFLSSLIFYNLKEFLQHRVKFTPGKISLTLSFMSAIRCQCDNNHDTQRLFWDTQRCHPILNFSFSTQGKYNMQLRGRLRKAGNIFFSPRFSITWLKLFTNR